MVFPASAGPALPRRIRSVLSVVFLFGLLIATRWPLAPKYLYYFDSINFALALDNFDPWHHQPQPPGYPLFVGLLRVVHLGFSDAQDTLVATGILVAFASILLVWRLSRTIWTSTTAAFIATALLIFSPPFWLGGLTNQVRLCLSMCSAGVALLAWRALQRPNSPASLYLAFAALGLAAGFRPIDCMLLLPLLVAVWFWTGARLARLLTAAASAAAAALPWAAVTAWAVGGPSRWFYLMWTYGADQFRGSSALFGAHPSSALDMALKAVVWTGIGVLTWVWALPFAGLETPEDHSPSRFFAAWLLPPFLFAIVIHIGDPDQTLTTVTGLCVLGGGVLDRVVRRIGRDHLAVPLAIGVAAANAVLFFVPLGRLLEPATWNVVNETDQRLRTAFDAIEALRGSGPTAIVHFESEVTWRHVFYYFPSDYLLYLPRDTRELSMSFHNRSLLVEGPGATSIPSVRRVIVLAPHLNPTWMQENGWQARGPVFWRDLDDTRMLQIGTWTVNALKYR